MRLRFETVLTLIFVLALLLGCKSFEKLTSNTAANTNANTGTSNSTNAASNSTAEVEPNEDGTIPSGTGTEKEKPAAGKGNVLAHHSTDEGRPCVLSCPCPRREPPAHPRHGPFPGAGASGTGRGHPRGGRLPDPQSAGPGHGVRRLPAAGCATRQERGA